MNRLAALIMIQHGGGKLSLGENYVARAAYDMDRRWKRRSSKTQAENQVFTALQQS